MPVINDATVVNQAYDTSGNGGRKLIKLKSGNQYAVVKNGTTEFRIYKSTDNWTTQGTLFFTGTFNTTDVALATDGKYVFVIFSTGAAVAMRSIDENGRVISTISVDGIQNATGNVSLTINDTGTELHAAWASINNVYPNLFNIRYAKGTINVAGSVTWGVVEQVTSQNATGRDYKNPSIIIDQSNIPIILIDSLESYQGTTSTISGRAILALKRNRSALPYVGANINANWSGKVVFDAVTYTQSSPSAIFVPQSVNGLPNGRIWVVWSGVDSFENAQFNIRVSYSDDGGATWSTMQKLTTGNEVVNHAENPSITANKNNDIFMLFDQGTYGTINFKRIKSVKNTNGIWGSVHTLTPLPINKHSKFASTLFDLSLNFTSPLFVYQNNQDNKVGFYGTWTVTNISVPQGSIGTKYDRSNLLTYAITTDGSMSTITEKVNGVTIATRNAPTSGQSFTVSLSQAQWDAVKYGKYANADGAFNTLEISMGVGKWTYTFDKRLASDAELVDVVKAAVDSDSVLLPAIKNELKESLINGGIPVVNNPDFDDILNALSEFTYLKSATGTAILASSGYKIFVSGIDFKAKLIVWFNNAYVGVWSDIPPFSTTRYLAHAYYTSTNGAVTGTGYDKTQANVTDNGFEIATSVQGTFTWYAIG